MAERLATQLHAAIEELIEAKIGLQSVLLGRECSPREAVKRVSNAREELIRILFALTHNRGAV